MLLLYKWFSLLISFNIFNYYNFTSSKVILYSRVFIISFHNLLIHFPFYAIDPSTIITLRKLFKVIKSCYLNSGVINFWFEVGMKEKMIIKITHFWSKLSNTYRHGTVPKIKITHKPLRLLDLIVQNIYWHGTVPRIKIEHKPFQLA